MEIRDEAAGMPKFAEFTSDAHIRCARLLADSGYITVDGIRKMQEASHQYFLADIRKGKSPKHMREIRLVIDLCGLFVIQKDDEKPKYEEITIPGNSNIGHVR